MKGKNRIMSLPNQIHKDKIDALELLKQFVAEENGVPIANIELLDHIDNIYFIWLTYDDGYNLDYQFYITHESENWGDFFDDQALNEFDLGYGFTAYSQNYESPES